MTFQLMPREAPVSPACFACLVLFQGHLWRHFLFLALESGAFLVAVSRSDDRCRSNLWLVAGPALLGEIYSITSVAWQRQQLFGGQDVTTAKKVA